MVHRLGLTGTALSGGEACGPLVPAASDSATLAPGEYQVMARICSSRGACGTFAATVTVVPGLAKAADPADSHNRRQRLISLLIDLLIAAARKLLVP